MLTVFGEQRPRREGVSRRDFIRVGALAMGGLSLVDLARLQAHGALQAGDRKSVIMIFLSGGPPHLDTYDMKPDAPAEYRGEFSPIRTKVPGLSICELLPKQAEIMDKLAILNGVVSDGEHSAHMVMTGFPDKVRRPCFGSVISYTKRSSGEMPPYVSLMNARDRHDVARNFWAEDPAYLGIANQPFASDGPLLENLKLAEAVDAHRLADRKDLLSRLDTLRRELDYRGEMSGLDAFTSKALGIITSSKTHDAFNVEKEPLAVRERYGEGNELFLRARRLVEAGVSVVTVSCGSFMCWDTHSNNFKAMRKLLPPLDQGIHALVTDLHERGMADDVAVLVWGEFGRTPLINKDAGRDHWEPAGSALLAGGGFKRGQAIGATDSRGERPAGRSITVGKVLATLYRHMGIDPAMTVPDNGRPMYLLDDREVIQELF